MTPQGWRTARSIWATLNPRPARSGPKPPSPLRPWQFLQSVALGAARSQDALPAAAWPAGWAETVCAIGSIRIATNIFFMGFLLWKANTIRDPRRQSGAGAIYWLLERGRRDNDHVRARPVLRRRLAPADIAPDVGGGGHRLGKRDTELLLVLGRAAR